MTLTNSPASTGKHCYLILTKNLTGVCRREDANKTRDSQVTCTCTPLFYQLPLFHFRALDLAES